MATQGGPAMNVVVDTSPGAQVEGGSAVPVAVVTGRAVTGNKATRVVVVSNPDHIEGGPAIPVVAAAAGDTAVEGGPAMRVYVVAGVLGASAPVNTAAPVISGTLAPGQTLSSDTGAWTNSPTSHSYQWLKNGVAIGGATTSTYVVQGGDSGATITVAVTASNASGPSAPATSAGVAISGFLAAIVAYYKLEDTSWADAAGGGGTLTPTASAPTIVVGRVNNAAQFVSASSQGLTHADSAALRVGNQDFAIACWVSFDTVPSDAWMVNKFVARSEYILSYASGSGGFRFTINDGTVETGMASNYFATTGAWYFVIGWYDAAADLMNISVQGGAPVQLAQTTGVSPTNGTFGVGCRNAVSRFVNGRIDEAFLAKAKPLQADVTFLAAGRVYGTWAAAPGAYPFSLTATRTLFTGSGATDWLGRPVLCDLGGGVWATAYRVAAQHTNLGDGRVHIRFSTDEGRTWTAEDKYTDGSSVSGAPFAPDATFDSSDPLLIKAPNGDLLLHILEQSNTAQHGTKQRRSTDGGKTWTNEGIINSDATISGGQSYAIVGSDIYIAVWSCPTVNNTAPFQSQLYKSTNNGTTWTKVSDITSTVENTDEPGIVYLGGTTFLAVLRDSNQLKTYTRTSADLGATWGALVDATATFSSIVQRARLKYLGSKLVLYGRDRPGATMWTALWISNDNGATWSDKKLLTPLGSADNGYCDILARSDGTYYEINYDGTTTTANIVDYVFTL